MSFTSLHFAGFFIVSILLGHLLKNRAQKIFLLLASYYFYGAFEPTYLFLILLSTAVDYVLALGIQAGYDIQKGGGRRSWERALARVSPRLWIVASMILNLSLLGYFKYTNFGIEVLNDLSPYGGTLLSWPTINVLLPIGISFYTFQSMSYTIDVYRQQLQARRSFVDFALYVAFFPQLVAGPIVRATTFFHDLDRKRSVGHEDMIVGLTRIVVGFFRKLVLADNLGLMVNEGFARYQSLSVLDLWIVGFGFGWQIYFDFAGYTDIARGVARLFGYEFEINFLYPMAARNIREHWQRWHLSLTTWIRDYLYIPLGGSRVSPARQNANIMIAWFLTGAWHGAAYHYIAWGISQGLSLLIHRQWSRTRLREWLHQHGGLSYSIAARVFLMFTLWFAFVLFRAPTLTDAMIFIGRGFSIYHLPELLKSLANLGGESGAWSLALSGPANWAWPTGIYTRYLQLLGFLYIYEYVFDRLQLEYFWKEGNRGKLILTLCAMILATIVFAPPESPNFIYFQF
ncbi:MAG: MBOAT family protein [Leptospirales bacterium]|nr:MBOAT family protein [Leptospirales bacterium]